MISAALLLLMASSPAPAQDQQKPPEKVYETPLGSRIARGAPSTFLEQDDLGKLHSQFAACVYSRRPELVNAFLEASDPTSFDFERMGLDRKDVNKRLVMEECLQQAMKTLKLWNVAMTMSLPTFRALMLEASYLAKHPTPPEWLAVMPSARRTYVADAEGLATAKGFGDLADCIVRAAPVASDAVLRTPPGSPAERSAVQVLVPALGECVPAGQTVELSLTAVRGYVADGLWTGDHGLRPPGEETFQEPQSADSAREQGGAVPATSGPARRISAAAQPATGAKATSGKGMPIPDGYEIASKDKSGRDLALAKARQLARCVVETDEPAGSAAEAWLLMPEVDRLPKAGSVPVVRLLWAVCDNLNDKPLRFGSSIFEGLLAEAVLKNKLPALAAKPPRTSYAADWTSLLPAARSIDETAICLTEQYPTAMAKLIGSSPGSSGEKASYGLLVPLVARCARSDAALTLDPSILRIAIAKAYFHRAHDSVVTGAILRSPAAAISASPASTGQS